MKETNTKRHSALKAGDTYVGRDGRKYKLLPGDSHRILLAHSGEDKAAYPVWAKTGRHSHDSSSDMPWDVVELESC